ncbi:MAG: hypothetical protein JRG94_27025 [Deltaproteobacteria bacterium]|nr:hypothetical protein [Deltaproteobacteria bacterium]
MITLSRSQWIWLAWSAVGAGIACAISLFVLDGIPHVQDEVVYQLQARLLTELRLWEVERLPRAAYPFEFVINEAGRRYGIFPNGWPAVLALGTAVGAPWLVNPLLHGLTVFLGARFSARLIGPRGGLFAAPLLALNPGLLLLASSRMSHTLCALLAVIALTCTQKATRAGALGLGFALAGLILTRPLDGLIATSVFLPLAFIQRPVRVWSWCLPVIAAGTLSQREHCSSSIRTTPSKAVGRAFHKTPTSLGGSGLRRCSSGDSPLNAMHSGLVRSVAASRPTKRSATRRKRPGEIRA